MENCEVDFQSAVENYQELSNSGKYMLYIQDDIVDDKCESLKKKWESLASSIPQRVETLKGELHSWKSFHEKLDAFLAWVEEMEGFTKIEKPRNEDEAVQQLKGLEVSDWLLSYSRPLSGWSSLICRAPVKSAERWILLMGGGYCRRVKEKELTQRVFQLE